MMEKLRRDSYVVGGALGILIPAVLFGILFGIFAIVLHFNPQMLVNKPNLIKVLTPDFILLAMIPNVLLLRYYLSKTKSPSAAVAVGNRWFSNENSVYPPLG